MTSTSANKAAKAPPNQKNQYWIMYVSLLVAGVLLLADAYTWPHLEKWTARLGIALIYTAVALLVGKGNTSSVIGSIILWVAVIVTIVI